MVEHGWVNTWHIDRPSSTDHLLLWKRLKYLLSFQDPISDNPGRLLINVNLIGFLVGRNKSHNPHIFVGRLTIFTVTSV